MDTIWAVISIVVSCIYGAGLVMKDQPDNFRFAKVLFWSSAILLGTWCFAWELMTEQPTYVRVIVGLIVGAFIFVVVPETMRRIPVSEKIVEGQKSPATNTMGDLPNNKGIVTQDQKGNNSQ